MAGYKKNFKIIHKIPQLIHMRALVVGKLLCRFFHDPQNGGAVVCFLAEDLRAFFQDPRALVESKDAGPGLTDAAIAP